MEEENGERILLVLVDFFPPPTSGGGPAEGRGGGRRMLFAPDRSGCGWFRRWRGAGCLVLAEFFGVELRDVFGLVGEASPALGKRNVRRLQLGLRGGLGQRQGFPCKFAVFPGSFQG